MNINQIKSKDRVLDHGEVLTPSWLVNEMLDLIPADGAKISSRYLENSSGEGAYLFEILKRKLEMIFKTYSDTSDREFYTVVGVTNIYGLELLKDNVEVCKSRLLDLVEDYFIRRYKLNTNSQFLKVIEHIININIINMDALNCKTPLFNNNQLLRDSSGNIIFSNELGKISEWEIEYQTREIKRVEYYYRDIVREQDDRFHYEKKLKDNEISLFDFNFQSDSFDTDTYIRVAQPIRTFEKAAYLNLISALVVKGGGLNEWT